LRCEPKGTRKIIKRKKQRKQQEKEARKKQEKERMRKKERSKRKKRGNANHCCLQSIGFSDITHNPSGKLKKILAPVPANRLLLLFLELAIL